MGNSPKKLFHIGADLGARFDEERPAPFRLLLAHGLRDFALVAQVRFVADENDDDVGAPLAAHVVDPFAGVLEGFQGGDVVDHYGHGGVTDVGGDEGAEAFLPSRVPKLQADGAVFEIHCLVGGKGD